MRIDSFTISRTVLQARILLVAVVATLTGVVRVLAVPYSTDSGADEGAAKGAVSNRFATSHNDSSYIHWIDLYDAQNNKITADSVRPYSPVTTCGRCHDLETIAHGFHFQAGDPQAIAGRPGQPWVWSDPRTGTHLPLSYRDWPGTWNPDELGISRWQMAAQFGGYLPGGGPGSPAHLAAGPSPADSPAAKDRTTLTGPLLIDCMLCHHSHGSGYSPFVWTEQIKQENFAYAPLAALGIGVVSGSVKRLKDDFDPQSAAGNDSLPKVQYEPSRFRSDGRVLFDLVRRPQNNACYYCHSQTTADAIQGNRWLHDEDVHLRAGMACVDCHRNGLDHATVRGYPGETHPAGDSAAVFSCRGCHLGTDSAAASDQAPSLVTSPGKLGAPRPIHRGIPPLHFERLECTACHSGPLPSDVQTQLLAGIHNLGEHIKWTGAESPWVGASIQLQKASDGAGGHKYAPHRWLWPSYWAVRQADGGLRPLHPEQVAQWLRRPLKVRQDLTKEIGEIKLTLSQRRELLGDERAKLDESQWSAAEKEKLQNREDELRTQQIQERLTQSLQALQAELPDGQAVFVSGGRVYALTDGVLVTTEASGLDDPAAPTMWPVAHNVRPATQALGAKSCTECHSDQAPFFPEPLVGIGVVPGQEVARLEPPTPMEGDARRMAAWNQLMQGRTLFKWFAVSVAAVIGLWLCGAVVTWNWPAASTTIAGRGVWLPRMGYAAFVGSVLVMGMTSFGSLARGQELHGWALLIHVSVAGAYLFLLAIVAYFYLPAGRPPVSTTVTHGSQWFRRVTATGMVATCLLTAVVMIPSMFPWLGTDTMLASMAVHRLAGMAALAFTAAHTLVLLVGGRRAA